MSHPQPLPPMIGRTENTLRALLNRALEASMISGYEAWVVLNRAATEPSASSEVASHVAGDLGSTSDAAYRTIRELIADGLLQATADSIHLTDLGDIALRDGRQRVGTATVRLMHGIDDDDLDVTMRVLERVRENALHALSSVGASDDDEAFLRAAARRRLDHVEW